MLSSAVHRRGNFHRGFRWPLASFKIMTECVMQVKDKSGSRNCINWTLEEEHKWYLQRTSIEKTALRLQIGNRTETTATDHTRFPLHSAGRYCCSQAAHVRALDYQPFFSTASGALVVGGVRDICSSSSSSIHPSRR